MKTRLSPGGPFRWIGVSLLGLISLYLGGAGQAAQRSDVFTDTDGDTYQVILSGPGTFTATRIDTGGGNGPLDTITVANTSIASALSVVVTKVVIDGKISLNAVAGAGALRLLKAPAANLVGAGVTLDQGVGQIIVGDIADGASIMSGVNRRLPRLVVSAGQVGTNTSLTASGQTLTLTAKSVAGLSLRAKNVALVKVVAGGYAGRVSVAGKLIALALKGGDFEGQINAAAIGTIRVAKDAQAHGGSIIDSTIAAATAISVISIDKDLVNTRILAGAKLGADGLLGGTDADSDAFDRGSIGSVTVAGNVTGAIVGAGLTPLDGVFGNGNDGVFGGRLSRLGRFTVFGTVSPDTILGGGVFGPVKISRVAVNPKVDVRFVLKRLLKGTVAPPAAMLAKAVDMTVPTNFATAVDFLFNGKPPVQTGVRKGTITPERAAVVRGVVRTRAGSALDGVTVTVTDHPELGETHTQADGSFDMGVNGGAPLDFKFEADGYVAVMRRVHVPQQQFTMIEPVSLTTADLAVTQVQFGAGSGMQMHEAMMQSDASGARQGVLMFAPGTTAMVVADDGSTAPMTSLNIRATELTVGADGPNAMPGALPPNSAYLLHRFLRG